MIEALRTNEGRISRPRSTHEINQNVRGLERPYERRECTPTLQQMISKDLLVVDGMTREYEELNGVATVQVKVPSESNGAGPPVAPAEYPEVNDGSQTPGDMLFEMGNSRSEIVTAAVITALLVLGIFLVGQGHERASEIVTWPIATATERAAKVTGEYTVKVKYAYGLNVTYFTDWRSVETYDDKRLAERHRESIRLRIRGGNPSEVAIRVDPQNPSRSSFRMAVGTRLRWIITPIILASLSFIWLLAVLNEAAALSGRRRQANAEINGPILIRLLGQRARRDHGNPSRQPPLSIKTRFLKGLCRLGLHAGAWGYLNEGECSQVRECGRCQAMNIRTKHQPSWKYAGKDTCVRNRVCSRCEAVGLQGIEHVSWSNIGDGMEKCDRCGTKTEISDGD